MTLFQSTAVAALFGAALLLTLLGGCLKKGHTLSFFGGLCFAACVVSVYLAQGTTQEVLVLALLLLTAAHLSRRDRGEEER